MSALKPRFSNAQVAQAYAKAGLLVQPAILAGGTLRPIHGTTPSKDPAQAAAMFAKRPTAEVAIVMGTGMIAVKIAGAAGSASWENPPRSSARNSARTILMNFKDGGIATMRFLAPSLVRGPSFSLFRVMIFAS